MPGQLISMLVRMGQLSIPIPVEILTVHPQQELVWRGGPSWLMS